MLLLAVLVLSCKLFHCHSMEYNEALVFSEIDMTLHPLQPRTNYWLFDINLNMSHTEVIGDNQYHPLFLSLGVKSRCHKTPTEDMKVFKLLLLSFLFALWMSLARQTKANTLPTKICPVGACNSEFMFYMPR